MVAPVLVLSQDRQLVTQVAVPEMQSIQVETVVFQLLNTVDQDLAAVEAQAVEASTAMAALIQEEVEVPQT